MQFKYVPLLLVASFIHAGRKHGNYTRLVISQSHNGLRDALTTNPCPITIPASLQSALLPPLHSTALSQTSPQSRPQINYYLDEPRAWALDIPELKRALDEARAGCVPRLLVVINPGNPTGSVLTRQNIEDIIKFAFEQKLIIMADEVGQGRWERGGGESCGDFGVI